MGHGDPGADTRVVLRHCTLCDWEAQLIEAPGEDPLCPWCYSRTDPAVVGRIVPEFPDPRDKNPHAASLGRLGGVKGGLARAASLTAKRRHDIALKAARARWGKKVR